MYDCIELIIQSYISLNLNETGALDSFEELCWFC